MALQTASDDDDSDDSAVAAFASVDFAGVDFDAGPHDKMALEWERRIAFGDFSFLQNAKPSDTSSLSGVQELAQLLSQGQYADALRGETAQSFFEGISEEAEGGSNVVNLLRQQVLLRGDSVVACVELELLGVAALNLFLQGNYTGPAFDDDGTSSPLKDIQEYEHVVDSKHLSPLAGIHPHSCFASLCDLANHFDDQHETAELTKSRRNSRYQNALLAELAVDGEWPVQVCQVPYFLLLARSIFLTIADPARMDWSASPAREHITARDEEQIPSQFLDATHSLIAAKLWCARAAVAHERLLQSRKPSSTLWSEVECMYSRCVQEFCSTKERPNCQGATVMLEWGLAEHHFDRPGTGKAAFREAQRLSGLKVQVTGAVGKRTKFQQVATAQMLVKAMSANSEEKAKDPSKGADNVKKQLVEYSAEDILLEKINFEDAKESDVKPLKILDQAILLALCLDVKNSNPVDGLTGEEMGAYLARVLHQHDDWMVYSTALLERSFLEFERSHARERAILQIQALVDQHTNRLTITQPTRQSVEESAPVQERLKNLHTIMYPPRWLLVQDLADRYAAIGIVTSAAELYTDIEFWGDVVDCYRRAGRVAKAEQIVRERLAVEETPSMLEALGDLTNDPIYYEKAIEVSMGRYSSAYIALGSFFFDKGELRTAAANYEKALAIRPLVPAAWFRLGTISMQLGEWDAALRAFSQVVQQEPEESDGWANVAAVHMHNKQPEEAYPALVESLKHFRNNWRVWVSKLYTCLDLEKYDEAIQACSFLMDLREAKQASDGIPPLEEKCVRAIVGGVLRDVQESKGDQAAVESSQRTLTRLDALLDRLNRSSDAELWVFETLAFFHQHTGNGEKTLENLMKEYRALQTVQRWERDEASIKKMHQVVSHIVSISCREGSQENMTKARFMVRGVISSIEAASPDGDSIALEEVEGLRALSPEIETHLRET